MKIWSEAWSNGEPIPERFAAARLGPAGVEPSDNLSPPLAWAQLPSGTRSLVLVCHDFDMPVPDGSPAAADQEIAADHPREDFFHWLLVDLPPTVTQMAEGDWRRGLSPQVPACPPGAQAARQGRNDCAGLVSMGSGAALHATGYHGPQPPAHDSLVHHYLITLYALSVPRLAVEGDFTGAQVRQALAGQVLGAATLSGTYTLNRRLRGA